MDTRPQNKTTEPHTAEAGQFETLILPHIDSLYGPAYRLTHSASDAEDLVQDTMLRAYTRFGSFRADGSPKAWLHTIMRNLFINTYRKKSREPKAVPFDSLDDPGIYGAATEGGVPRPTTSSPERVVLSQMEGAALLRAVAALPEEYRDVVVMADVDGLTYQEIADGLQIPVGTVRSRLNRGRKRVQRALFSWRGNDTVPGGITNPMPA
jgi:RNA polymerase sigma-70 factor (ECF subfamily)